AWLSVAVGGRRRPSREQGSSGDWVHREQSAPRAPARGARGSHAHEPVSLREALQAGQGVSPHRFVVRRRIDAATALLIESTTSIGSIARAVGFRTASHFATTVRRITGRTPSAHRGRGAVTAPPAEAPPAVAAPAAKTL